MSVEPTFNLGEEVRSAENSDAKPTAGNAVPVASLPVPTTTRTDIWLEIIAVLAVGVLPPLSNAILSLLLPGGGSYPYVLDAFWLIAMGTCSAYVVLYLVYRSGELPESFGIAPPQPYDWIFGIILFGALQVLYTLLNAAFPNHVWPHSFPLPRAPHEYVLMVFKYAVGAFSEEVITRAYLMTRLNTLYRSKIAVLLLSTIAFTSYHIYWGALGTVYIFGAGLLYSICFLLVPRIWPLVIGHALFNIALDVYEP